MAGTLHRPACGAKWAYAGITGVRLQPTSTQGIRYGMADVPEGVQYATNGLRSDKRALTTRADAPPSIA